MTDQQDEKLSDWKEAHGIKGNPEWKFPHVASLSREAIRADQGNMTSSSEFIDEPEVFAQKIKLVAQLLKQSKFCVAYCGAGLSKAAGISDYASDPSKTVVQGQSVGSPFLAQPTLAHHCLVTLQKAGILKELVQQNHDGIPQKAGFPQELINEIHGAWYDPSNPVVQFNGSLRNDLFEWLIRTEETEDLCLCLGTSLSKMNADRIAETPAKKLNKKGESSNSLGTVIINLQRTRLDKISSIRIWAKLDDALSAIISELGLNVNKINPKDVSPFVTTATLNGMEVFDVPYDINGQLNKDYRLRLDLRDGQKLIVVAPGSVTLGKSGRITGRTQEGDFFVAITKLRPMVLGRWWIDSAIRGAIPQLPIINANPICWKPGTDNEPPKPEPLPQITEPILVYQSHQLVEEGKAHVWSLRMQSDPSTMDAIKKVTWKLPPHCHSGIVQCLEPPFKVSETERGKAFTVPIEIEFHAPLSGYFINADFPLTFDVEGVDIKGISIPISLAQKPETNEQCLIC